jgi:predicted nucleic acid-binding protein
MDLYGYLDSSVILRRLLRQKDAISDLTRWRLFSSQLVDVEVRRTLLRYHAERALSVASFAKRLLEWKVFHDSMEIIPISNGIMQRAAEPFPTLLNSLDAIHLATALGWTARTQQPVTILTHDRRLGAAASACGFSVGP